MSELCCEASAVASAHRLGRYRMAQIVCSAELCCSSSSDRRQVARRRARMPIGLSPSPRMQNLRYRRSTRESGCWQSPLVAIRLVLRFAQGASESGATFVASPRETLFRIACLRLPGLGELDENSLSRRRRKKS
jgi:hypothetical protein